MVEIPRLSHSVIVQELEYKNSVKLSASHLLDISQIQHQRGQNESTGCSWKMRFAKWTMPSEKCQQAERHLTQELLC